MTHDPMCPCNEPGHTHYEYAPSRLCTYCRCGLIAKVRDESKSAIAAAEQRGWDNGYDAGRRDERAELRDPGTAATRGAYEQGQRDAIEGAVQRVEALADDMDASTEWCRDYELDRTGNTRNPRIWIREAVAAIKGES
jgi:hypothetical protein